MTELSPLGSIAPYRGPASGRRRWAYRDTQGLARGDCDVCGWFGRTAAFMPGTASASGELEVEGSWIPRLLLVRAWRTTKTGEPGEVRRRLAATGDVGSSPTDGFLR